MEEEETHTCEINNSVCLFVHISRRDADLNTSHVQSFSQNKQDIHP